MILKNVISMRYYFFDNWAKCTWNVEPIYGTG